MIKWGKRILLAIFLLLLTGCTSNREPSKIHLIVKSQNSDFWLSVKKGALACAEKNGYELVFLGPDEEYEYAEQIGIFEQSLSEQPDAIILAAGDFYLMSEPVKESKIPVFIIDSSVAGNYGEVVVMTDNAKIGADLGYEVMRRFGTTGTVGVINYVQTTSTAIERWNGFSETIAQNSDLEIVQVSYCDADIDLAEQQTRELLGKYPNLDVLVGLNAQSTIGAARAVEALNKEIFVGGVDCMVEQADYIEKGIIDVTVLQNPYMMGFYSVELVAQVLKGKSVEKTYFVDTYIIDSQTLFDKESQELIFPIE